MTSVCGHPRQSNSKPKKEILCLVDLAKQSFPFMFSTVSFPLTTYYRFLLQVQNVAYTWVYIYNCPFLLPVKATLVSQHTSMLKTPTYSMILMIFLANAFLPFLFAYTFTVTNNCPQTIWPGILAGAGTPPLLTTGFRLDSGLTATIPAVAGWSGRIWARTGCTFDESGLGKCQTGDCGGKLLCGGAGATPPASLFEITLGTGNQKDFYDVSIVDGYNLPLIAGPVGVYGGCNVTGCVSDINMGCPKELQVVGGGGGEGGGVVACKSACEAFGLDQYCCSGQFANPTTCRPSFYSSFFKNACPRAYSYAYDDGTSTFTCKASNYAIVFCPNFVHTGMKRSNYAIPDHPLMHLQHDENKMITDVASPSGTVELIPLPLVIGILAVINLFILNM